MGGRAIYRRLYFFEVFLLLNFVVVATMMAGKGFLFFQTIPMTLVLTGILLAGCILAGLAIRFAAERRLGRAGEYARIIRSRGWLIDLGRLVIAAVVTNHVYSWIKLTVPLFHPRLFDEALWNFDRALFFGGAPSVFFLHLFGKGSAIRFIDWTYANIFFIGMIVVWAFFLSHPSRRVRVAFMDGNVVLWVLGAWLYLLLPSLGPAYRFPDLWLAFDEQLRTTHHFQALLMKNYQNVLHLESNPRLPVSLLYGIAAFPSLHVAFQTFSFFWMRRLWLSGQVLFGTFVFLIFIGSMVTGWHYLIDGIAGIALAWGCYAVFAGRHRVARFLRVAQASRLRS